MLYIAVLCHEWGWKSEMVSENVIASSHVISRRMSNTRGSWAKRRVVQEYLAK